MSSTKHNLRLAGSLATLIIAAVTVSCTGFFVNPTLSSIAIGPQNLSLSPTATQQMVATGTFSDGSTSDVTGKSTWSSSNEAVANFSPSIVGELVAGSLQNIPNPPGTTTVSASDGAITSSSITVTVCPVVETMTITATPTTVTAGDVVTFDAMATFAGVTGSQDVTDEVTWNISNTTILPSITDGSGTTTASTSGTTSVSATLCGATSSAITISVAD
ncbi:MAG: hypothetical protein WB919_19905 [Candidatus Sulfotelmatobacter sp.]